MHVVLLHGNGACRENKCILKKIHIPCEVLMVLSYYFGSTVYRCIYGCVFCVILFNFVCYIFLLLCLCMYFFNVCSALIILFQSVLCTVCL